MDTVRHIVLKWQTLRGKRLAIPIVYELFIKDNTEFEFSRIIYIWIKAFTNAQTGNS